MESIKESLVTVCKGLGILFILLLLNTRSGEAGVNGIKILLDIIIAIILVGNYRIGRRIALFIAALTVIVTCMMIPAGLETIILIAIAVLGGVILKNAPEDDEKDFENQNYYTEHTYAENDRLVWNAQNVFWPFEKYSYAPDDGIHICKGVLKRSYIIIPTINTRIKVDQSAIQHILGLCEISFLDNYTGQKFGEESLRNVRFKFALELMRMLT